MALHFCKPEQSSKLTWLSNSATFGEQGLCKCQHCPKFISPSWMNREVIGCYNPWDPWAQTGHVVHLRWYGEVLLCRSRVRIGSHDQPERRSTTGPWDQVMVAFWTHCTVMVTSDFFEASWVVILKTHFKSVAWCKWFNFRLCFQGKMNGFRA